MRIIGKCCFELEDHIHFEFHVSHERTRFSENYAKLFSESNSLVQLLFCVEINPEMDEL